MTIAVTGASGQLGQLALKAIRARAPDEQVIALARSPEKLAEAGFEIRALDYDEVPTLGPALAAVDTLVLISSSEIGKRKAQHHNVIAAAKAAGVTRIVYTSVLRADTSSLSVADEHRAAEAELKSSGVAWTILRNGWYNENYTGSVAGALHSGALIDSAGEGKVSSATRADYADALAVVATSGSHDGRTYELAGDAAWTLADLAAEVSRQSGREIAYKNLPEKEYAAALVNAGISEPYAGLIAGWGVEASNGALFDDRRELSGLIGRPTTPMSATVAQVVG